MKKKCLNKKFYVKNYQKCDKVSPMSFFKYSLISTIVESAIGAFIPMLLFFAVRENPISMNLSASLLISGCFFAITGLSAYKNGLLYHFPFNLWVSFIVSYVLAVAFHLVEPSVIFSFSSLFTGPIIIGVWMGLISAMIYDKAHTKDPLDMKWFNGRK